jgi:hypothetical protein
MKGYPLNRVYEEVAFIAFHFNWSYEELMEMDHKERRKWCEEISRINKSLNENVQNLS